jgi:hypothetical protein
MLLYIVLHFLAEAFEVAVYRSYSLFGMVNVEGPAIAVFSNPDAGYVTIGNGKHLFAGGTLRFEVYPGMEMTGSELSEIAGQQEGDIQRGMKRIVQVAALAVKAGKREK